MSAGVRWHALEWRRARIPYTLRESNSMRQHPWIPSRGPKPRLYGYTGAGAASPAIWNRRHAAPAALDLQISSLRLVDR